MDILKQLVKVEEKIETYYIHLAQLEFQGMKESVEYQDYVKLINDLINQEKSLFASLSHEDILSLRKYFQTRCSQIDSPIIIGCLVNSYYFRILQLLNACLGDDSFEYASVLRYDLNQIIFAFLEFLIGNDYYSDIRKDLIFYKYNLIFMNYRSEDDFFVANDISTVSLESKGYRTDDFPASLFVDKAVLVLESTDYISSIMGLGEDFKDNEATYTKGVVSLLEVIARLMLCEKDTLPLIYDDLMALLEDEVLPLSVKALVQEMLEILNQLKTKFQWAR